MYHLDKRGTEEIKDKNKSVSDTGKNCFLEKDLQPDCPLSPKNSLLVYAFPPFLLQSLSRE